MSCTVRNQSEGGFLLAFGETPYLPSQVEIVLDNRKTLMPISVVWRDQARIGVAFPHGRFMSELIEETAKAELALAVLKPGSALH